MVMLAVPMDGGLAALAMAHLRVGTKISFLEKTCLESDVNAKKRALMT